MDRFEYCLSVSDSFWTGMYVVCQYETDSGHVCVLSVSMRQFLDRYVYCLSVSDSFLTGMCIVCQYQFGQVCILSDRYWTGMCNVCQYETVSGQVCVLSVSIREFLDRYMYCLSVSDSF